MKGDNQLSAFQHFALIVTVVLGTGIFTLPRLVAAEAGRAAWLVVLASCLATGLLALVANHFSTRFPGLDAAASPERLLGRPLGRIWLLLYLVRSLAVVFITAEIYADILGVRQYPLTPCPVICALVILLAVFLASYGIGALTRYCQLVFLLTLPLVVILPLALAKADLHQLLPLLQDSSLSALAKGVPPVLYSTAGYDILWFSYPHLKQKQRSGSAVLAALLFVTLIYTLFTVAATAGLGYNRLLTTLFPTLSMLSRLELSLVARVDIAVLYLWLLSVVATAAGSLYISSRLLQSLIGHLSVGQGAIALGLLLLAAVCFDLSPQQLSGFSQLVGNYDLILLSSSLLLFQILCLVGKGREQPAKKR